MFKNAIFYRIEIPLPTSTDMNDALAKQSFQSCSATQEKSIGWVPPRAEHGLFLESIGGHWIAKLQIETKAVPAQVLERKVNEMAKRIEESTGRKPGKKGRKEIKDEAKLELLPHAFPKRTACWVWIDPKASTLLIDTSSQSRADDVVNALVEAIPGLVIRWPSTVQTPSNAMAQWLVDQEPPAQFSIGRECELQAIDESKAVVKYGRHPLEIAEVQEHIKQGKWPTKLSLTWDARVEFVLTEGMQLRKLTLLDVVAESKDAEGFDADVAIFTGEMSKLLPDLMVALGGQAEAGMESKVKATDGAASAPIQTPPPDPYFDGGGPDPIYDQAVELVIKDRKASIAYVQRKLRIGYNRSARLLEDMEKAGLVSALTASGQRDVLA